MYKIVVILNNKNKYKIFSKKLMIKYSLELRKYSIYSISLMPIKMV